MDIRYRSHRAAERTPMRRVRSRDGRRPRAWLRWKRWWRARSGSLTAVGVYLVLRRTTFPVVIGLTFLSYAVNLYLFADGTSGRSTARRSSSPGVGLYRPAAAGAGPDRDRHLVRNDGADRRDRAARLSRNRLRSTRSRRHRMTPTAPAGAYRRRTHPMTDLIVLPTVLPALTAAFLLLAARYDLKRQRVISVAATAGLLAIAICAVRAGQRRRAASLSCSAIGRRRSASCWCSTACRRRCCCSPPLLALCVVLYAVNGWDARGRHFHAAVPVPADGHQRRLSDRRRVQPVRVLRGDADRVLRAACCMAADRAGCRRGLQYVAINLLGSTLFLFAVGPDLRRHRHAQHGRPRGQGAAGAARPTRRCCAPGRCCCFVFSRSRRRSCRCIWWLPATYAAASPPAAALFMIMTKVGAYAILRVYGLSSAVAAGAARRARRALDAAGRAR